MSAWDSDPYGSSKRKPIGEGYGQQQGEPDMNARSVSGRSVIPLRPLSVGETLDAAVRLIRFNPVPFIVFPIIVNLVAGAINVLIGVLFGETTFTSVGDTGINLPIAFSILSAIVSLSANLIVLVAGTRVTLATIRAQKLTLGETFQLAKKQFGTLAARMFVLMLIMLVVGIAYALIVAFIIVTFFDSLTGGGGSVFVGVVILPIVLIALTFLAFYRFSVTAPAMVAEDIGPIRGISRSWNLTKGSLGYFIGLMFAVIAIGIALTIVMSILFGVFIGLGVANESGSGYFVTTGVFGTIVASLISTILIAPIATAVTNLVYVNMRMKRENFHQDALFQAGRDRIEGRFDTKGPGAELGYGAQYSQTQYGETQYGQAYGSSYGQTQYGQTQYGQTQYEQTQYGQQSPGGYGQWSSQQSATGNAESEPQHPQWYDQGTPPDGDDTDSPSPFSPR